MTRHETRQQLISELGVDAERMIDAELKHITISYNGAEDRAIMAIEMAMGLRILPLERCHALLDQARAIAKARKRQLEMS